LCGEPRPWDNGAGSFFELTALELGNESCCFVAGELASGLTLREPHRPARVTEVGMAGVV
jgi:hypothetical protein